MGVFSVKYAHGGNLIKAAKVYGLPPEEFLDFSANVNPFGPPQSALDAVVASLDQIRWYPDPDCTDLRESLGQYLGIEPRNIVPGNGANELIHLAVRTLKPSTSLIIAPTFSEYGRAVEIGGGSVVWFPVHGSDGFLPDMKLLASQLDDVELVFVCNPGNPSGALVPKEQLLVLLDEAEARGVMVVIDEAFVDFVEDPKGATLRWEAVSRENLVVLGSLTKFFALPGLRLGYAVCSDQVAGRIGEVKDPWSVNWLAQRAAIRSVDDSSYIDRIRGWVKTERQFMFQSLSHIKNLKVYLPSANYVLVDLRASSVTAQELQKKLGPRGILIRDCSNYPFLDEYYARFAIRTREENQILLANLEGLMRV